jgi:hypothetical protein
MERRRRTFPIHFARYRPTRFAKEELKMYFDHEWRAYQQSLHRDTPYVPEDPDADAPSYAPPDAAVPQNSAPQDGATAPPPENIADANQPVSADANSVNPADDTSPTPESVASDSATPGVSSTSLASSTSSTSFFRPAPDFARHARRCCICTHPDRDAIEGDFVRWRSPGLIAREYNIASRNSIYRHAHCAGLFAWRRQELGRVLEGVLENAEHVPLASSDVLIRAARIYAHLDEHGNWFEPPRTNFILTGAAPALYPLESAMSRNSARSKRRSTKSRKKARPSVRSNRYIGTFRKKVK